MKYVSLFDLNCARGQREFNLNTFYMIKILYFIVLSVLRYKHIIVYNLEFYETPHVSCNDSLNSYIAHNDSLLLTKYTNIHIFLKKSKLKR